MGLIFPKGFKTSLSSPMSAATVAGLIWAGCVMPDDETELDESLPYARPTTGLWMNAELLSIEDPDKRRAWYRAHLIGQAAATALQREWSVETEQWYATNSRETIRKGLYIIGAQFGAMSQGIGVKTNAGSARWIMRRSFAQLFDPALEGDTLREAIDAWTNTTMDPEQRLRAVIARERQSAASSISVVLPSGDVRHLSPGESSLILKGVIEVWAEQRLREPAVLTISEPGDKKAYVDERRLAAVGININVSDLLPDALIVDMGHRPAEFWIIEAVATGGPVDERRKQNFIEWAQTQRIRPEQLRFLNAFISRNDSAARRHLMDLAVGTYAWYLDEPTRELAWNAIETTIPDNVVDLGNSR
ncbi:BsuBI/PstI family type II restriction endonuclease [Arthrobacter sp. S39]|uniref:BsuBI/PstI family type II restriction endonuclease n=1 Tax=Arthrobacter sp. S39 TaxID=2509720 RepID=UPI0013EF77FA|nr:BsuBI/PstI family type II restriction endonuclease [Arthrobacter sp. S39]